MPRTVFLSEREVSPPSQHPRLGPQYSARVSRVPNRFPNRIRSYRLRAGCTQREAAEQIPCSPSTFSAWERGMSFPSGARCIRLARVFSTLVESLYYDLYTQAKYFQSWQDHEPTPIHMTSPRRLGPIRTAVPVGRGSSWSPHPATEVLDAAVRARHHGTPTPEPFWVPAPGRGATREARLVSEAEWHGAAPEWKAELLTHRWERRVNAGRERPVSGRSVAAMYQQCLALFRKERLHALPAMPVIKNHVPHEQRSR